MMFVNQDLLETSLLLNSISIKIITKEKFKHKKKLSTFIETPGSILGLDIRTYIVCRKDRILSIIF